MKRGVIFDFDGVIIDSFKVQKKALLESYKIVVGEGTPSLEEFFSYSGDSIENIFRQMNLPLSMVEPYKKISRENLDSIVVFDGIFELLAHLKNREYKIGLCTGKNRERTIEILDYLGLSRYFNAVVCSDDVEHPKPAPDSLETVIRCLGIDKKNAVMVGDAPNDIQCANNLDVKSIAVTWGEIGRERLEEEQPDCIINHVYELEDAIEILLRTERRRIC